MQVGGNAMYLCMFGVLCCIWKSCLMYIAGMYVRSVLMCRYVSQCMSHYTVVVYAHYSVPSAIRLSAMLSVATTLHSVAGSAPHSLSDFPLHHLQRLAVLWVGGGRNAFVWGDAWSPVNALWVGGLEHTGWL